MHGTLVAHCPGMASGTSPWSGFPFTTVLFDVDGTLIDSNAAHAESWHQALREHDVDATLARVRSLVGMGSDNLLPALAQISDESDLGRSIAQRAEALIGIAQPKKGIVSDRDPESAADQRCSCPRAISA